MVVLVTLTWSAGGLAGPRAVPWTADSATVQLRVGSTVAFVLPEDASAAVADPSALDVKLAHARRLEITALRAGEAKVLLGFAKEAHPIALEVLPHDVERLRKLLAAVPATACARPDKRGGGCGLGPVMDLAQQGDAAAAVRALQRLATADPSSVALQALLDAYDTDRAPVWLGQQAVLGLTVGVGQQRSVALGEDIVLVLSPDGAGVTAAQAGKRALLLAGVEPGESTVDVITAGGGRTRLLVSVEDALPSDLGEAGVARFAACEARAEVSQPSCASQLAAALDRTGAPELAAEARARARGAPGPRPLAEQWLALGRALSRDGAFEAAAAVLARCEADAPTAFECSKVLGAALARTGRGPEAVEAYRRFLRHAPRSHRAYDVVRRSVEDYERAVR